MNSFPQGQCTSNVRVYIEGRGDIYARRRVEKEEFRMRGID